MSKKFKQLTISELILESKHTKVELQDLFNRNDIQKSFILNAIRNGNLEFLKELREAKYNLNIHQNDGIYRSSMTEALHSNKLEIVQFLHESNVPIDNETLENAFWRKCSIQIIIYLRDHLVIHKPEHFINLCKEFTPQHLETYAKKYENM